MALKVIELLVDDALTGDTRVEEIALVLQPAIETEFIWFNQQPFAEVGERGGIKESKKAPKSDTPNRDPKGEGSAKGDASSTRGAEVTERVEKILKDKADEFNDRYKDKLGYGVNVGMLKSVYQRGVGAYNTSHSPAVKSSEQWALARVNAFLYIVKNGRPENSKYVGDNDLLPTEHPKKEKMSYDFAESISDYPESVKNNAKKVLKYVEENGWGSCGTPVGKQRASQLAKGEPISVDTLNRMFSYLSRHKKDLQSSKSYEDGCGKLMYDSWGGEEALTWSESKLETIREEMEINTGNLSPWSKTLGDVMITGDTEMCGCGERYEMGEGEIDVYGYKTKYFYICPGAQGTFKDIMSVKPTEDSIGMIRSAAVVADKVFEIEANVFKNKTATEEQLSEAIVLVEDFKDIIAEIQKIQGKSFDVSYMENHIKTIESYVGQENMAYYPIGQIQPDSLITGNDCGCGCPDNGCWDSNGGTYFAITINGVPVFDNPAQAATYAQVIGCNGSHVHMVDGVEMYMPCEIHSDAIDQDDELGEYTEQEYEIAKLLQFLSRTDKQKFEAVIESMRGATLQEIKDRDHKTPTTYFKYERVLTGSPDREFCDSIEDRYFRRLEIDLLRDTNREFGHKREPYSKWLYKGGPNCVHAWRKFLVQGKDVVDQGFAAGKAGMPPKSMPNNGYYSEETKKASEKAYAISQSQRMSRASSQVIIVDMDDTLVRGNSPIKKTIDYINEKAKTYRIVVVSGRQKSRTEETKRHLNELGVLWDDIYLSDFPQGPNASNAFKEYKAKWLMEKGYQIVEAIDNDAEARRAYQRAGVKSISPVSLSMGYSKQAQFSIDEEQRMLYSPAMKPGILIPRIDEITREKYFVTFKPETIKVMSQRFLIEKRTDKTNYEHSNQKFDGVYLVESWIVDGEQDKAYNMGYSKQDVPVGTWMVGYRVDNDEVWEMIKQGKVKGLSIEGNFEYKFSVENTDRYLLKEIINILNQIN